MNRVALFSHHACSAHDPGPGHPECPDRLRAVLAALDHRDFANLLREQAPLATEAQLCLAHPAAYVRDILSLHPSDDELRALDPDTFVGPGSVVAARHAAGAAIAAVDSVMEGWADLFSNAAIAAEHASRHWGLKRVAVVDFDVHHGNGTQHILETDPAFLYVSSHQYPCYPGTGAASETGYSRNVVNLPLAPGSGSSAFRAAWENKGLPALRAFKPELLIVSAGFDAHRIDPLAQINLETEDFGWITDQLMAASGGRLVSLLEGGYDLMALAASAALHVRRLITAPL